MTPTEKNPEIDRALTSLTGVDRQATIRNNGCAFSCGNPNLNFRDAVSRKEYQISGICQSCQDAFFGGSSGADL